MRTRFAAGLATVLVAASASGCSLINRTPDPATVVHTRVVLRTVGAGSLETASQVVTARAKAQGLNAKTAIEGDTLVVSVQGEIDPAGLVAVGALRFRKVLDMAPAVGSGAETPADPGPVRSRDEVVAKLGPAWQAAQALPPEFAAPTAAALEALKPFRTLTPSEVAALPVEMQLLVPTIRCEQLNGRLIDAVRKAEERVVTCDPTGTKKYLLDVAKVATADVRGTRAQRDENTQKGAVLLTFTTEGQARWTGLTREIFNDEGTKCAESTRGGMGHCLVAVVTDHHVITAPEVQGVITGDAVISSGTFSEAEAKTLAAQIGGGELPVPLKIVSSEVVRP